MKRSGSERERELRERLFSARDLALLSAMAGEPLGAERAACLTEGMDVDTESSVYLLALGILGFRSGWDAFPPDVAPRLKGLHRYYQVRTGAGTPWLREQLSRLSGAGIPAVLTGGLAMRAFYAPDVPRLMNGFEITVRTDDYERAASVLREALMDAPRERTVNGLTKILLRRGVPERDLFREDAFWGRAKPCSCLGFDVLAPSPEDLLLRLFGVPFGPALLRERREERDRRLYEAGFVLKSGRIDFERLGETARAHGRTAQVRFFLRVLSGCAPNALPERQWASAFPAEEEYDAFLRDHCRLDEAMRRRAERGRPSLSGSLALARAEWRTVRPVRSAAGEKTGFLPYYLETRQPRRVLRGLWNGARENEGREDGKK